MKVDPRTIDRGLLSELLEAGVLVFWKDRENGDYLGLKPAARRELYQLPPPLGSFYQDLGVSKMTAKNARKGIEHAQSGRIGPHGESRVTDLQEVKASE